MKKTFLTTSLILAIAASVTTSFAFTWGDLNPANWGNPKCEKVCQKDNCSCKQKCKKEKCDPYNKHECNTCKPRCEKKADCNPCQKTTAPCNTCKPMTECNPCDRLQEMAE